MAYRADPGAAEEREKRRWEKRHLTGLTLDNTGMLSGTCGDTVAYEIVRTAAEAFAPPGGQGDTRTAAQRRMDGLVAACKAALDGGSAPERHGAVPYISVLVHDQTLAQAAGGQAADTPQGAAAQPAGPHAAAGPASVLVTGAPGPMAGAPGRGRAARTSGRAARAGAGRRRARPGTAAC